jgi:L-gulonate 5-dehydrogenase
MKALIYTGLKTLEHRDVPCPDPKPGEDLIKVMVSGICGSDMHAFLGHDNRRPAPLILGHEAAGVVTGGTNHGRRVTINPLVTCQTCDNCRAGRTNLCPQRQIISMPPREGAFAEYVTMPRENLVTVPDSVPLEKAALAEPLACGWHGVRVGLGRTQAATNSLRGLAIGGGAIGIGAALAMQAQGITDITLIEPNEIRRDYLHDKCSFRVIHPDALEQNALFDMVVDGVGYAATRATASQRACPGGVIVHIGLGEDTGGLDIRRMTLQEITFVGTYTYTAEDFRQTAAAIFEGRLGALDWATTLPLMQGQSAFEDIRSGRAAAPKILLIPEHAGTDQ